MQSEQANRTVKDTLAAVMSASQGKSSSAMEIILK
jgi:hypothetical protein